MGSSCCAIDPTGLLRGGGTKLILIAYRVAPEGGAIEKERAMRFSMAKRKGGAALLAAILLVACSAVFLLGKAWAAGPEQHDISEGNVVLTDEGGICPGHVVTGSTDNYQLIVRSGEHNVTLRDVEMKMEHSATWNQCAPIKIEGGTLNLKLEGKNVLEGDDDRAGIRVGEDASLVIEGPGELWAKGGTSGSAGLSGLGGAGIGGNSGEGSGNITIKGGNIFAKGAGGAAGIGSGYMAAGSTEGDITIEGGKVVAKGGEAGASTGAGIGGGENVDYEGTITINGGIVYAIGGDANQPSIGGGGTAIGETGQGTFTTGVGGHAIIVAAWGIGDQRNVANWDCIYIPQGGSIEDLTYDAETGGVTFNKNVAVVYGEPEVDYNITIGENAALEVSENSTLTIKEGSKLTNNSPQDTNGRFGLTLLEDSTLVLEGGIEQCLGDNGSMSSKDRARIVLPVTEELVSLELPAGGLVYNGQEQEPSVVVAFDKWGCEPSFTFKKGTDYELDYLNNEKATSEGNLASVTVLAKKGGSLIAPSEAELKFSIAKADVKPTFPETWTVQKGEDQLLSKLPKATFASGTLDEAKQGTLEWFSDSDRATRLTNDAVSDLNDGDMRTVYWRYALDNANFNVPVNGSITLTVRDLPVPDVSFARIEDGAKTVTYGDNDFHLEVALTDKDGSPVKVKSPVTWASSDKNVVTVDESGNVAIVGFGEAAVKAMVAEYVPEQPSEDLGYASVSGTVQVTVNKKQISVDESSVEITSRAYDGTNQVEVSAKLEAGSILEADEGQVKFEASGTLKDPNAGESKPVDIVYSLSGDRSRHYELTPGTDKGTVTISKADPEQAGIKAKDGTLTIYNNAARTYTYNLNNLRPDGQTPIIDVKYKVDELNLSFSGYFDENGITFDGKAKLMTIKVAAVESEDTSDLGTIELTLETVNYQDMNAIITVKRENTWLITPEAGKGGSVNPSKSFRVLNNASASVVATPEEGFKIASVMVDGEPVNLAADEAWNAETSTYTFENVTANHAIAVSFEEENPNPPTPPVVKKYIIDASAATKGGTISPNGKVEVAKGDNKTFTVKANEGYKIGEVVVDGKAIVFPEDEEADAQAMALRDSEKTFVYTFEDVQEDHTITASFEKVGGGTVDPGPEPGPDPEPEPEPGPDEPITPIDPVDPGDGGNDGNGGNGDSGNRDGSDKLASTGDPLAAASLAAGAVALGAAACAAFAVRASRKVR